MRTILLLLLVSCSSVHTPAPLDVISPPVDIYSTSSSLKSIQDAVKVMNCLIKSESFLKAVGSSGGYDYTDKSPSMVEESLRSIHPIKVSSYKTKSPFSRVLATTYKSDRSTLYINTRKLPRSLPSLVNTITHESTHLIGFSHGDNSSVGKDKSVPYLVGDIAEKYVTECESK
jgi:hypothetical protein